jgi:hypothetical protein
LRVSWPNNAIAAFGDKLYRDMVLMEAHVELSPAYVAGILDTIRNRVLTFALEIEKEAPEAVEVPASEVGVSQHRINQIFHTYGSANRAWSSPWRSRSFCSRSRSRPCGAGLLCAPPDRYAQARNRDRSIAPKKVGS